MRSAVTDAARQAAAAALAEDLAGYGDITGGAFAGTGTARVVAREAGVLSGRDAFLATAEMLGNALRVEFVHADGDAFSVGETLAIVEGSLSAIFALERTGLNFLGRLSGVATLTARYVAQTSGTRARVAATRKTTPGLRALEKQAVVHGGGTPHRFGLFDGVMIKDNHVAAAGGVLAAAALVRTHAPHTAGFEIEVDSPAQVGEALEAGAAVILLDNMTTEEVRQAVHLIAGRALVEVSGGVRLERVRELAEAGADVISVGSLTTRAEWIDIALDLEA